MHYVRIYEIPDCKMVSSAVGMFGDGKLERFDEWFSTQPRGIFPRDYLTFDASDPENPGMRWLYLFAEGMTVPDDLELIDFKGGLYAVATDIDGQTDTDAMAAEVDAFLAAHNLERDPSRPELGNVITPPSAQDALGFGQMDYWFPVKVK